MLATAVGSMPGEDFGEVLRVVIDAVPDLVPVPELPARGPAAGLPGRGVAVLDGLAFDLQPAGWRLTDAPGMDQRRARSLLAHDLDLAEEALQDHDGPVKIQVPGPLTLAATMERPRGDRILADHGARRELAQSLASGLTEHVADAVRRFGDGVTVQVDEPAIRAVLDGEVPTASGWGRHRHVDVAEAELALSGVAAAIVGAGGRPVAHTCAAGAPVAVLSRAGFAAVSFDQTLVSDVEYDDFAQVFDGGTDLWPGVVPSMQPAEGAPSEDRLVASVRTFFAALGYDEGSYAARVTVTPTCGLAGASPVWAREALRLAAVVARG